LALFKNWETSVPWYSASNMHRRFLAEGNPKITVEGLNAGSRMAPAGATLLLVRGSGLFNYIPICLADEPVAFNQDVKAICAKPHVDPTFLHFWIESLRPHLRENIGVTGIGAGKFDTDFLKALPFPDLPKEEQKKIGLYAASFDRRIDLNLKMNETLEAMARLFFKDWFVDFGPTRAKAESRPPYLAPELWPLFPDALDDDDKPLGWSIQPLDQIANFLNGLALQKYPATGADSLPVIKIAQLRTGVTTNSDRASTNLPHQYVVEDGDVLFSWSGSLMHLVWAGGRGALNQHLFKVTSSQYPKWFFFYWISEHMPNFQAIAASKATTMGHIQRHHLAEALITIPTDPILAAADDLISPLFDQIMANNLECRSLAQTRDLLLPKLMSGEIRLREAEKLVEQVA
jgi:type I restriction enzyme S subunit